MADVNCDLDSNSRPDVVATAFHLPFRNECFDAALFTDVIEHLPRRTEFAALAEIRRCLGDKGVLLLTTPNNILLFKIMDPAWWIFGHRHYHVRPLAAELTRAGFEIIDQFSSGGIYQALELLLYYFKRPFYLATGQKPPASTSLGPKVNQEYRLAASKGYTIYIRAQKNETNSTTSGMFRSSIKPVAIQGLES